MIALALYRERKERQSGCKMLKGCRADTRMK
jgi:hypothetical protein